jgi:nucleotide-binding universal stress UspA family protein
MQTKQENQEGTKWLVPIDGSKNSESALNFAIDRLDKKKDTLFLLNVVDELNSYYYGVGTTIYSQETVQEMQNKKELAAKSFLSKTAKQVRKEIPNVRIMMGISNETGDTIIKAIEKNGIQICCMGRRGFGKLKRLFIGSVSSYVIEHANCAVIVVKGEYGPKEIHDSSLNSVKKAEEIERIRRIEQSQNEEKNQFDQRALDSECNKNITVSLEEDERKRRIEEEKEKSIKEEADRIASKIGVIVEEEEERKRRMEENESERGHLFEILKLED